MDFSFTNFTHRIKVRKELMCSGEIGVEALTVPKNTVPEGTSKNVVPTRVLYISYMY